MFENLILVVIQFATNLQLKDLNHMFCPWISFHKLYKKNVLFGVLTLHVPIWDELKKT